MCEPTTLLALSVASSAAGLYAQQNAANAQAYANRQNYQSQMTAYRYNTANANFQKVQEAENLSARKMDISSEVAQKQATARTAAGEGGVEGLSVQSLLGEIASQGGKAVTNAEVNYLRGDRAIEADRMNSWASAATGIGNLRTPTAPNYLGAALQIGQSFDAYNQARGGTAPKATS